jgi:hypothetical protein
MKNGDRPPSLLTVKGAGSSSARSLISVSLNCAYPRSGMHRIADCRRPPQSQRRFALVPHVGAPPLRLPRKMRGVYPRKVGAMLVPIQKLRTPQKTESFATCGHTVVGMLTILSPILSLLSCRLHAFIAGSPQWIKLDIRVPLWIPGETQSCESAGCEGIMVGVSTRDRAHLEAVVADRNSPQKHVWRAAIDLARPTHWTATIRQHHFGFAKTLSSPVGFG